MLIVDKKSDISNELMWKLVKVYQLNVNKFIIFFLYYVHYSYKYDIWSWSLINYSIQNVNSMTCVFVSRVQYAHAPATIIWSIGLFGSLFSKCVTKRRKLVYFLKM